MFFSVTDEVLLRCNKCKNEFSFWGNELDFDAQLIDEDRGMGEEFEHYSQGEYECPECGQQVTINVSVSEYPIGAYNSHNEYADGAELLNSIVNI